MAESTKTGDEEFGEAVRRARERLGMSRRDLAETTGLSYPYISQIETGYRMPSTPAMRSLADALGLRPDSLFDAISPTVARDAAASAPVEPSPPAAATPRAAAPLAASAPRAPAVTPPPSAPSGAGRTRTAAAGGGAPPPRGAGPAIPAARHVDGPAVADAPVGAPPGSGAADGWVTNRSFQPMAARAAAAPPPRQDAVVDQAVALLTTLPTADRLPALTEVQARVLRSVVEDEVRRAR